MTNKKNTSNKRWRNRNLKAQRKRERKVKRKWLRNNKQIDKERHITWASENRPKQRELCRKSYERNLAFSRFSKNQAKRKRRGYFKRHPLEQPKYMIYLLWKGLRTFKRKIRHLLSVLKDIL